MMTRDRAFELIRWGQHYAKPRCKNAAEYSKALSMIDQDPALAEALSWPQPPEGKKDR